MSFREVIEWHDVGERMPDDDHTVMVYVPSGSEPVWLGWHEDGQWYEVNAARIDGVERWAELPKGEATA